MNTLFVPYFLKRRPVIVGEAIDAVARRDVAEARAPERQRIDQRLAEDDLFRRCQRLFVPHAPVRSRQIQMSGVPSRRPCA